MTCAPTRTSPSKPANFNAPTSMNSWLATTHRIVWNANPPGAKPTPKVAGEPLTTLNW